MDAGGGELTLTGLMGNLTGGYHGEGRARVGSAGLDWTGLDDGEQSVSLYVYIRMSTSN
jgi:hypothetical protein